LLPKLNVGAQGQEFFKIWVKEVNLAYGNLESQLELTIQSLRASGISDQAIFNRLKADLDAKTDIFSSFNGGIEGANGDLLHLEAQLSSSAEVENAADLFTWTLDPTAQHCGDCLANEAKGEFPFEFWQGLGLPGMGNTECGEFCACSLDPV
jgi:hypothetical protein